MKAVQASGYGGPEVIQVNEVANPTLKPGQVLVEVHAASINPFDVKLISGAYKNIPVVFPVTVGGDFAGIVREVPEGVHEFSKGDEVYGQAIVLSGSSGSMAQFVAANVASTARKPAKANWIQAGALPLVGSSAVQALTQHMQLRAGQKILIHGGAGGIGSTAIQLAKALGAYVATTASAKDIDFVKSLGADLAIDYKTQKFEDIIKEYDAAYDTVGGEVAEKSLGVLKKGGIIVSMLGEPNPEKAKELDITSIGQQTKTTTAHLKTLAQFVDDGKITIQVDKVFPLEKASEAFAYEVTSHPRGKVVLQIEV